jgi:hypothetical protein
MRCDRKKPCDRCVKSGLECMYKTTEQRLTTTAFHSTSGQNTEAASTRPPEGDVDLGKAQHVSILLSTKPSSQPSGHLHPPVSHIWSIYHIFSDNVDPLLKLIHLPSFHHQVLSAIEDVLAMDIGTETLLFAIYFSACVSISNTECVQRFKMEKIEALQRYVHQFSIWVYRLDRSLSFSAILRFPHRL